MPNGYGGGHDGPLRSDEQETTWDTQVGGTHYKSEYQHWDLVADTDMGYFEGQATRYICRWRKPSGGEGEKDLRKALHYLDKLKSLLPKVKPSHDLPRICALRTALNRLVSIFAEENNLSLTESSILRAIVCWQDVVDLDIARTFVQQLIIDNYPPKPVPLTEENKHADRA